jgi:signal transduction histidine kinase
MRAVLQINASRIETDEYGFASLARIHAAIEQEAAGEVHVDCSRLQWVDANMCAPLAAAIIAPERRIRLQNLHPSIAAVLQKNGFLGEVLEDTHGTTIRYQQFDPTGRAEFAAYVEHNFRGKGLPVMSIGLQREFRRSIFELFENAVAHSNTRLGIFACGQFFPKKHRLHFCLADRGIGIPNSVRGYLGRALRASEAIDWAMTGQNTTRRVEDGVPGGLGLKIMRDFIAQNGGAIRVASEDGFWWVRGEDVGRVTLPAAFPGTVVDIENNAADTKMYQLAGEVDPTAIF